jgi:hypothetical protein
MIGGIAAIVFAFKTRDETEPEWYIKSRSHSTKLGDKTDEIGLYFAGIMFILLGIGALLDATGIYNFK